MMTIKEVAQMGLDVQDACNLSGIVRSWARVMDTLWEEANEKRLGTQFVNTHPVNILFMDKVRSLCGDDFSAAYTWAKENSK